MVSTETLKHGGQCLVNEMTDLLNSCWSSAQVPEDWRRGVIVKLPKKGNLAGCNNWRGITLLSVPARCLGSSSSEDFIRPWTRNSGRSKPDFTVAGRAQSRSSSCVASSNTVWNTSSVSRSIASISQRPSIVSNEIPSGTSRSHMAVRQNISNPLTSI